MARKSKDISTLIGIVMAFGLIGAAISFGGEASSFFDTPSVLIVLGGTVAVTIASFSLGEVFRIPGMVLRNVFRRHENPREVAMEVLEMAELSRKKGVLALQEVTANSHLPRFLKLGLSMIVDGVDINDVERTLKSEMYSMHDRHQHGASVLRKMAEVAPAMGLIGTLIGLVQMLGNLEDPSKIGPAMAVALITTLYGALLAYAFFTPLAAKLERISSEEMLVNTLYLRGVASIGKQENPRRLEMMLNSVLPPAYRVQFFD